jgi:hypothetical protein
MINIIPTSPREVTYGAWALIKLAQGNQEELIDLFQIERKVGETRKYTFIALFREKGTIGQLVAFINEWGTSFGPGAGGTGSAGFRKIRSFIEDSELELETFVWEEIDSVLRERLMSDSLQIRLEAWEDFVMEQLPICMMSFLEYARDYPINDNWK